MPDSQMLDSKILARAYYQACLAEIEALKPGNVHIFADGHGMVVQDFIRSAEVSAPVIAQTDLPLGERIFLSVEATWQAVNCNTNLGIILLCAPLIQATLKQNKAAFNHQVSAVIQASTLQDTQYVFDAIKLANPAGLGQANQHDVHVPAQTNLLNVMQAAATKDLIARQYCNGFADVLTIALPYYREILLRWDKPVWATTALYLYWMSNYPDSHVQRKYSETAAFKLQSQAKLHLAKLLACSNPKTYQMELMQFDGTLKTERINPGTSADLTVATLLTHALLALI